MRPVSQQTAPLIQRGNVVVFQGDSITDAFRKPEEIIDAYQLGAGYVLMIAATLLRNRPADALGFFNRGVSGNTICDLTARWNQDTIGLKPAVISLLVGINDICQQIGGNSACSPEQFERDYRALLQSSRAARPGVRFVLCEPFAFPHGRVNERWLSPLAERQWIVEALAREFDAVFVPLQREFDKVARRPSPEYWIHDGIHPTAPGHRLIAQAWLNAARRQVMRRVPISRPRIATYATSPK
jgi:lysophospholipase L1-like esterase